MIKEHPENGCGHDLRQKENQEKEYEDPEYCIATQYFCYECKMSFCGKCVHENRMKNPNAHKTGQNVTSVEGSVLFKDDKRKPKVDVPKSILYINPKYDV